MNKASLCISETSKKREVMSKLESAELFAKNKHRDQLYGNKPYWNHLVGVVSRLKSIGITDEDVLCSAWLHDTIEDTDTTFDEIYQRFGRTVAVMVSSLTKDNSLPKSKKEKQYLTQLKDAPWEAQLIKLCDISANLSELKNSSWSKTRKKNYIKRKLQNLEAIKSGISDNKSKIPNVESIIAGINEILKKHGHRPIII